MNHVGPMGQGVVQLGASDAEVDAALAGNPALREKAAHLQGTGDQTEVRSYPEVFVPPVPATPTLNAGEEQTSRRKRVPKPETPLQKLRRGIREANELARAARTRARNLREILRAWSVPKLGKDRLLLEAPVIHLGPPDPDQEAPEVVVLVDGEIPPPRQPFGRRTTGAAGHEDQHEPFFSEPRSQGFWDRSIPPHYALAFLGAAAVVIIAGSYWLGHNYDLTIRMPF